MVKNIYVFDDSSSSSKNGIGTFIKELLLIMKRMSHNINLLSFNSKEDEFAIREENGIVRYIFPKINNDHNYLKYYDIIDKFMRLYISDSLNNIFLLNHSPCEQLLKSIKFTYPLSRRLFVIHDQVWTSPLSGRVELLKLILIKKNRNKREEYIYHRFMEEQRMYALVDGVVCLSGSTFDILTDIYKVPADKIFIIPNGIRLSKLIYDTDKLRNQLFLPKREKILLYVGRATKQKGFLILVKSFERVLKKGHNLRLVVIGVLKEDMLEYLSQKYSSIMSRITLIGFLRKRELYKWYTVSNIAIIPSLYEQCSYVGIEMMMYGLPIIASDAIGLRDILRDGENAIIAKIGNPKNDYEEFTTNLTNCIVRLLSSEKLKKRISSNITDTFIKQYHSCHMRKRYNKMIEELDVSI